ncbi:hypothetical protein BpHYR1_023921 [Brachionus plicatilis]|uniref:Uncharacterized protein n=1 Tax=Brachionus plicatilis TaxID=10195 RepID=A0A3M7R5L6_BRAPC|nr:hypothetical protein BpHYR1_023921 [Brachionus plicatilis]
MSMLFELRVSSLRTISNVVKSFGVTMSNCNNNTSKSNRPWSRGPSCPASWAACPVAAASTGFCSWLCLAQR